MRATLILVPLLAMALVTACGDDGGGTVPQPGANHTLSNIAAAPLTNLPSPYTVDSTTLKDATSAEKLAGSAGTVHEALTGGPGTASIDFLVFDDASKAAAYAQTFGGALPRGVARKFLPQLPNADCADTSSGGACGVAVAATFVETRAPQVDGPDGAGALAVAAAAYLNQGGAHAAVASTSAPSNGGADATDPCALLTSDDAQSALGSPVTPARPAGASCMYAGRSGTGASATLEIAEGGRSKFDFDRSRVQGTQNVTGVGDAAFVFISQAGFVQVYAVKGESYFVLTLANPSDTSRQAHAVALARQIASRIH
jgi:hypothetical protein